MSDPPIPSIEDALSLPLNEDQRLWRYMDLAKFLRLIQAQALWFGNYGALADPFEASMTLAQHKRFSTIGARAAMEREVRAGLRRGAYASCWHANEVESAAMWSLYGGAGSAIAVITSVGKLRSSIPFFAYLAPVKYIDYAIEDFDDRQPMNRLLHKRKSFEHEREYRAVVIDFRELPGSNGPPPDHPQSRGIDSAKRAGGLEFVADLRSLIDEIVVSPAAPHWFESVVSTACTQAGFDFLTRGSDLDSPALF